MGRKSEKEGDICICIADSLCCTGETQHCKAKIPQFTKKKKKKGRRCHEAKPSLSLPMTAPITARSPGKGLTEELLSA